MATEPTADAGAGGVEGVDPAPEPPPAASRGGLRVVRGDARTEAGASADAPSADGASAAGTLVDGTLVDGAPVASGPGAARRFVGRVAQLDHGAVHDAVAAWRASMRDDAAAWFAAEEAVARAVVTSGRHHEQRVLLVPLAEAFAYGVWYDGPRGRLQRTPGEAAPELRVHATEASGQYAATLAMLALLVRDYLAPATFALLYGPFAPHIPVAELGRE